MSLDKMQKIFAFTQLYMSVLFFHCQPAIAQDLYDRQHSIAYAKHLYQHKQFDDFLGESARILAFRYENDTLASHILLASAYLNNISRVKYYHARFDSNYHQSVVWRASIYTANPLLKSQQELIAGLYADNVLNDTMKTEVLLKLYMQAFNWKTSADMVTNPLIRQAIKKEAIPIIQRAFYEKYKSPMLAIALSTLAPGSGKVYTGEWKDGLFSTMIVGLSAYGLYRVISQNGFDSPWSAMVGGIFLGFYGGNIYGSYASARKVNQQKRKIINDLADNIIYGF